MSSRSSTVPAASRATRAVAVRTLANCPDGCPIHGTLSSHREGRECLMDVEDAHAPSAEGARTSSRGGPEVWAELRRIADDARVRAGFAVCAVEVLRADGLLEEVVSTGNADFEAGRGQTTRSAMSAESWRRATATASSSSSPRRTWTRRSRRRSGGTAMCPPCPSRAIPGDGGRWTCWWRTLTTPRAALVSCSTSTSPWVDAVPDRRSCRGSPTAWSWRYRPSWPSSIARS